MKRKKLPRGSSPTCPQCRKRCKSTVTDSRQAGDNIRRRRKCLNCAFRYTTYESNVADDMDAVREWLSDNLLPKIEELFKSTTP